MNAAISLVFFASGAAALIFETLWFRQTGLLLGNTVWASSLVTASFMLGLALGNLVALRTAFRLRRPLRFFAGLELTVAVTGATLVFLLARLSAVFAPLLASLEGFALDAVRLAGSFALLVVPAAAMGTTLPVLARSLGARDRNFGRVLGRLYGWNTLGAVAGAWCGEWFLVPAFGVQSTGLVAAGLNILAAGGAWLLDRRAAPLPVLPRPAAELPSRATRLGMAALLAGGLLLALEVVWFRFLTMFLDVTSTVFAVMLAVVLLGIAAGALLGSAWLGRRPADSRYAAVIALAAGAAVVVTYLLFDVRTQPAPNLLAVSLRLMGPTCVCSGLLFTFLGRSLYGNAPEESQAAGLLTLSNTIGATAGSLLAGFVLLPFAGMERSFFGLALAYGLVAALAGGGTTALGKAVAVIAWGVFASTIVAFPFGQMTARYVRDLELRYGKRTGARVAAMREGLTETVFLLREDLLGAPVRWRLLTNGQSMSTTGYTGRRYMGFFAWWPVAVRPGPRQALVISYGVGNTARSLAATPSLTHIDVVDVSSDVLALSPLIWSNPGDDPLRDPRVRVNIEDGRFFLLTSRRRYDVITGEPPPPALHGIVSLYSREYFQLMRDRLNEEGVATYWLPVHMLAPGSAYAIIQGFCDAFDDCSLWSAYGQDWMLAGTRGLASAASEEGFARQWHHPAANAALRAAGFDSPERLGATFLADATQLAELTSGTEPLVDDHPHRLDPRRRQFAAEDYVRLMEVDGARRRFETSEWIRRTWPAGWRTKTLAAFDAQQAMNDFTSARQGRKPWSRLAAEHRALREGPEALFLWMLQTSFEEYEVAVRLQAAGSSDPAVFELLGLGALARRQYADAETLLARAESHAPHAAAIRRWRVLALALAGDRSGAARLLAESGPLRERSAGDAADWEWLAEFVKSGGARAALGSWDAGPPCAYTVPVDWNSGSRLTVSPRAYENSV